MHRYETTVEFTVADVMRPLPENVQEQIRERFFRFIEEDVAQQVRDLLQSAESAGK